MHGVKSSNFYNPSFYLLNDAKTFLSDKLKKTATIIQTVITNPIFIGSILLIVGIGMGQIAGRITQKILPPSILELKSPFMEMSKAECIILSPIICILIPIQEEIIFRGFLQPIIENSLEDLLEKYNVSHRCAAITAALVSIVATSVLFGLYHFLNALFFLCNPILIVPQVVIATVFGIGLGILSKFGRPSFGRPFTFESMFYPSCAHIGNNTFCLINMILKV